MSVKLNQMSLEKKFSSLCFPDRLPEKDTQFPNFFEPNEGNPERVLPLLKKIFSQNPQIAGKSMAVAVVGGERVNWWALFGEYFQSIGGNLQIIGCDINSDIKMYNDANYSIIKVSKTIEEYRQLTSPVEDQNSLDQRISILQEKIESSSISPEAKKYYLNHAKRMYSIYLNASKEWRNKDCFSLFNYCKNEKLFRKLKSFVDSGNVISTMININKLTFFKGTEISFVDISNCSHYTVIDLDLDQKSTPQVIWTDIINKRFEYRSFCSSALGVRQKNNFNDFLEVIKKSTTAKEQYPHGDPYALWLTGQLRCYNKNGSNAPYGAFYTKETLEVLERYCEENIRCVNGQDRELIYINLGTEDIARLNQLPLESIAEIGEWEEVDFSKIIEGSKHLSPQVNLAFAQSKLWQSAFEKYFTKKSCELADFLKHLAHGEVLEEFCSILKNSAILNNTKVCNESN